MREAQTKTLGQTQYRVRPLGAKQGCRVITRLSKLLGSAFKSGAKDQNAMLGAALESLGEEDLDFFCRQFETHTQISVDGSKWPTLSDVFDVHFSQNYGELLLWLKFCLEVNFSGFFAETLGSLVGGSSANPA